MAEMSAVTFYRSHYEAVKALEPTDYKAVVNAMLEYAFTGENPEGLTPLQRAVFEMAKVNIDYSNDRRKKRAEINAQYNETKRQDKNEDEQDKTEVRQDKTEVRPSKTEVRQDKTEVRQDKTTVRQDKTVYDNNVNVNVNENVNENVNVKENENEKEKNISSALLEYKTGTDVNKKRVGVKGGNFSPPTVDEVTAYCEERNNGVNAQAFVDFYTSKGWMVGKNKMKDWKAAVRTWEQRKPSGSGYVETIANRVNMVDSW